MYKCSNVRMCLDAFKLSPEKLDLSELEGIQIQVYIKMQNDDLTITTKYDIVKYNATQQENQKP